MSISCSSSSQLTSQLELLSQLLEHSDSHAPPNLLVPCIDSEASRPCSWQTRPHLCSSSLLDKLVHLLNFFIFFHCFFVLRRTFCVVYAAYGAHGLYRFFLSRFLHSSIFIANLQCCLERRVTATSIPRASSKTCVCSSF